MLRNALVVLALSASHAAPVFAQSAAVSDADSLFDAGDWEGSAAAYRHLVEEDSSRIRAWVRLGTSYRNARDFDAAEDVFDGLLARQMLGASFVETERAKVFAAAGRRNDALTALEAASAAGLSNVAALDSDPLFDSVRHEERFSVVRTAADRRARPCVYDPHYEDFDFWLGSWDVFGAGGGLAGSNEITKVDASCLIQEKWVGRSGGTGTSMNFYDPHTETWTQQWVSGSGTIIRVEGGLREGSMVLEGKIKYAGGNEAPFRGTWTLLEDGRVRQFFEQFDTAGDEWSTWFEGFYVLRD